MAKGQRPSDMAQLGPARPRFSPLAPAFLSKNSFRKQYINISPPFAPRRPYNSHNAIPTVPGVASATPNQSSPASPPPSHPSTQPKTCHNNHNHHIVLPLDSQCVPPDPAVLALGQPATAALSYAAREVLFHVVLPLLALWLLQRWLDRIEKRTREEVLDGTAAVSRGGGAAPSAPLLR
ncbi:hypothetical protein Agub_g56, partial [Astrephomene gubernaculifera]